uniref:GOLD domain-containing protein n=1 Tax=Electrophorus electricus TaxID=8005 RepID=A0A4W4HD91_ELEEL
MALQKQQDSSETLITPPCPDLRDSSLNPGTHSKSSQSPECKVNSKKGHLVIEGKPGVKYFLTPSFFLSRAEVAIMAASMWTRPQIKEFKEKMVQDMESVIIVGRGEVLTVRVSTHEDGSYLFWEFATDHYDIGFGLYFEWANEADGTRTVEPSVDGQMTALMSHDRDVYTINSHCEVVPVYRRDSHEEVYAGSHQYPGQGVYLLKFDNSYSLWRSKVVYYRVYYTR